MSPTSYRTALPRVIRPKRFAPTAKIIIARFAAPVNPCGENFPIHYKGRGRQRALYGPRRSFPLPHHKVAAPRPQNRPDKKSASRSFPRPRPHHKVAAPRPPSAKKARDRKTVQTKNQHRGRSPRPRPPSAEKARARKTVQTKNQHRGRSPGSAHITKSRHPRSPSAERPTKPSRCKTGIQSPRPPLCTQKARPPCGSRASFAGNQALILRMAVAVTCVGAALVPASALS